MPFPVADDMEIQDYFAKRQYTFSSFVGEKLVGAYFVGR